MKYFVACVNTPLVNGNHNVTSIRFLAKRHRASDGVWEYTVKIGYGFVDSLDNVNNKPYQFRLAGDWSDAIHHIFGRRFSNGSSKLEHLTEITI